MRRWNAPAMLIARSLLFNALFYLTTIVLMIVGLPTLLLGRRSILALARLWGAISLWLLKMTCGLRVDYRGVENIPSGGALVAVKHQSFLETFALLRHMPDFAIILKRELTYLPMFGLYLVVSKQIAIDRGQGLKALRKVVSETRPALAAGRKIIIYPEGTRRPPGAPADYKSGIAALYAEARAPCLPVAVNTGLFWKRRSLIRRPGVAVIEFLPAIEPGLRRTAFMRKLEDAIEAACGGLNAEAIARDPALTAAVAVAKDSEKERIR